MSRAATTTYHQRIAQEKRELILTAATALFLELGYDRTSLARIAERAGVSRATLFKQFPSKAALFDAIVTDAPYGVVHGAQRRRRATSSTDCAPSGVATPSC